MNPYKAKYNHEMKTTTHGDGRTVVDMTLLHHYTPTSRAGNTRESLARRCCSALSRLAHTQAIASIHDLFSSMLPSP